MMNEKGVFEQKGLCILLVEDNPSHTALIADALNKDNIMHKIYYMVDGPRAMHYLMREGKYTDDEKYPQPDLIILDLKLPGLSGKEVLRKIKSDERTRSIPVIVLTSSAQFEDFEECYKLGARGCVTKPVNINEFDRIVKAIPSFWCH